MNKFDVHSSKFIGIIIFICFIFILVIWNAFNYLPKDSEKSSTIRTEIVVPTDEEVREKQPEAEEVSVEEPIREEKVAAEDEYKEPVYDRHKIYREKQQASETRGEEELKPLEPIDRNEQMKEELPVPQIDPLEEALGKAKEYRMSRKPISAISEYQKAVSLTDDASIKAQCYENIAIIYASAKRYGSALSAAQKAYNTEPTVSREVLLARLYYKTGNVDKANYRVNNVLKREFSREW